MDNKLQQALLASIVRHGLTALSAYLVSQQLLAPEHSATFVTQLTGYVVDALPALVAMAWSLAHKYDTHSK
jgi:hypothetical protein